MQPVIVLADGKRIPTAPGSRLAVTKQDNDLTKPDSIQAAYTTTFTLPDAQEVKASQEYANLGTSPTRKPYQQQKAALEVLGVELLPRGLLQLQGFTPGTGFESQMFGGNKDFYSTLGEKKIRELQLGGSHLWQLGPVAAGLARAANAWQDVYAYDLLDRGRALPDAGQAWNIYQQELYPSVFARAVWEQIFREAGYAWAGTLPESFDRATLPAPLAYGWSEETRKANSAVWGWKHRNYANGDGGGYRTWSDITRRELTVPLNYVGPADPFGVGSGITVDGDALVLGKTGYYDLKGALAVYTSSFVGTQGTDVIVQGYIGGVGATVNFCHDYAETNATNGTTTQHSCSAERVLLPARTRLWLKVVATQESDILLSDYWRVGDGDGTQPSSLEITESQDNASLQVTLLQEFPEGALIQPQDWLPDMTCKAFILQFVLAYGLTQRPHPYLNLIEFYPTSPTIVASLATAPTWDGKVDAGKPRQRRYQLGNFAQVNYLAWAEDQTNWGPQDLEGKVAKLLGQGILTCEDENLEAEKDLFTMAFAATPTGQQGLPLVAKWKLKEGGLPGSTDVEDYEEQTPAPRLLLRSSSRTRAVPLQDNSGGTALAVVPLSYFADTTEPQDLSFSRTLGPTYYQVLQAALRAPLLLPWYIRYSLPEIVEFTQGQAVWLESEGAYFYVNKINQYETTTASTATDLIRLLF